MAKKNDTQASGIEWAQFWVHFERPDLHDNLRREMWIDLRLAQHLETTSVDAQVEILEYAPEWLFKVPPKTFPSRDEIINVIKNIKPKTWKELGRECPSLFAPEEKKPVQEISPIISAFEQHLLDRMNERKNVGTTK